MDPTPDRERSTDRSHAVVRAFVRATSSAAGEDVHELLTLLRRTLPAHFAFEERSGGFLDQLESRGVSVVLLDRLRVEHREFLERLEALDRALQAGTWQMRELAILAERLREHEWIESMLAAQRGISAPTDPLVEAPPVIHTVSRPVAQTLETIADRCRSIAAEGTNGDLLAAVTVSVPNDVPLEGAIAALEHALAGRGLDFVEVRSCAGDDVRLCGARFRRPRLER